MKKIAICMVTYNRAVIVDDIIKHWLPMIAADVGDIYVYDSSTNNETESLTNELRNLYSNLHYIRIRSDIHSNEKVYQIYKSEYICKNYKYVWMIPDYYVLSNCVIKEILDDLNKEYDMYMVDIHDVEGVGSRTCEDKNEIFFRYAWALTHYGTMIVNSSSVLNVADWEYFEKKYLVPEHKNFSHVALYFEMMIRIDDFRFYHKSISVIDVYSSKYLGTSRYLNEYFEIWAEYWPSTVYDLPDFYVNKREAIKRLSTYSGNMGSKNLIQLRKASVLTCKKFWKYVMKWNQVSSASRGMFFLCTYAPVKWIEKIAVYNGFKGAFYELCNEIKLKHFCKKYKIIYLYGAGICAERYVKFLKKNKIDFHGFLVTYQDKTESELLGHPVRVFSSVDISKDVGIIVAVSEKYRKEILSILYKTEAKNNLFVENLFLC